MSEQQLNRAQIRPCFQQMRREGMAQEVRRDGLGQSGIFPRLPTNKLESGKNRVLEIAKSGC
jgi:hypothetical protein